MTLPTHVEYPIFAIGDLHGQLAWLDQLIAKLERLPEWPTAQLVFLGDLVDRGPSVKQVVARVLELLAAKPGSTCVMGNHDLALVKRGRPRPPATAGLLGRRYHSHYDHRRPSALPRSELRPALGRRPRRSPGRDAARASRPACRSAVDRRGVGPSLSAQRPLAGARLPGDGPGGPPAPEALGPARREPPPRQRHSDRLFKPEYPVWLGADKHLSARPLEYPGKVQVTGHVRVEEPDANATRIRIDTSGGERQPLTACLLRGPHEPPEFVFSPGGDGLILTPSARTTIWFPGSALQAVKPSRQGVGLRSLAESGNRGKPRVSRSGDGARSPM